MGKRRAVRAGRLPRPLRGGGDDPATANAMRLAVLAKQPPKRSARPPHPDAPTIAYARQLERIAAQSYRYALPLIAELRRLQALADAARADLDDQPPPDEPPAQLPLPFAVRREVEIMRRRLTIYRHNLPTEGIAAKAADQLEKWRIHVDQRILGDLGLQPVKAGTELAAARDAWVRDNAALISSQPAEVAARIEAAVAEMVPGGARWETIAAKLESEHGIATNRANLIARDQVSKYNADLNRIRQQAAGIDFFQWRGAMDNRERPAHVALEGTVWAWAKPPMIGAPGEAIQCLPGDSPLHFAPDISVAYRRWHHGKLLTFVSDSGPLLRCTPNHPIFTLFGWKPAKDIQIGDQFLCDIGPVADKALGGHDIERANTTIQQVFDALSVVFLIVGQHALAGDLHGDAAIDQKIDVVRVAGSLRDHIEPMSLQEGAQIALALADVTLIAESPEYDGVAMVLTHWLASDSVVRGLSKALAIVCGGLAHADKHRIGAVAWRDAIVSQAQADRSTGKAKAVCDALDAFAGLVGGDDLGLREILAVVGGPMRGGVRPPSGAQGFGQIISADAERLSDLCESGRITKHRFRTVKKIGSEDFAGHVYNLETAMGWYHSNAIVHNCRCSATPCVSDQLTARAGEMTEADLLDRTAALGPTQKQGEGATAAEVRERAAKEIANEIKLARNRAQVVGRQKQAPGQKAP